MEKVYRNSGVLNPTSEKIGQMNFDGNITPHTWYLSPLLQSDKGKPNLVAITLLADIIYWYRPTLIRDEQTGAVIGVKQKFSADKLQKHYENWGRIFGLTKRQVEDAMAFLKSRVLITVETRAVETSRGVLPNCAFIEPVFEAIHKITFPSPEKTGDSIRAKPRVHVPKKRGVSPGKMGDTPRKNGTRVPEKRENSYTTSEISSKTTSKNLPPTLVPHAATMDEEEELKTSSVKIEVTDEQSVRVESMIGQIAKITGTRIDIDDLRPLALECVQREHKDAWTHTLATLKTKMACDKKPTMPNRYAATVLKTALQSPVPPKAAPRAASAPQAAQPETKENRAPAETQGDAPAEWAYKQARKELSCQGAAAFKAKHGRTSEHADWVAYARILETEAAL